MAYLFCETFKKDSYGYTKIFDEKENLLNETRWTNDAASGDTYEETAFKYDALNRVIKKNNIKIEYFDWGFRETQIAEEKGRYFDEEYRWNNTEMFIPYEKGDILSVKETKLIDNRLVKKIKESDFLKNKITIQNYVYDDFSRVSEIIIEENNKLSRIKKFEYSENTEVIYYKSDIDTYYVEKTIFKDKRKDEIVAKINYRKYKTLFYIDTFKIIEFIDNIKKVEKYYLTSDVDIAIKNNEFQLFKENELMSEDKYKLEINNKNYKNSIETYHYDNEGDVFKIEVNYPPFLEGQSRRVYDYLINKHIEYPNVVELDFYKIVTECKFLLSKNKFMLDEKKTSYYKCTKGNTV